MQYIASLFMVLIVSFTTLPAFAADDSKGLEDFRDNAELSDADIDLLLYILNDYIQHHTFGGSERPHGGSDSILMPQNSSPHSATADLPKSGKGDNIDLEIPDGHVSTLGSIANHIFQIIHLLGENDATWDKIVTDETRFNEKFLKILGLLRGSLRDERDSAHGANSNSVFATAPSILTRSFELQLMALALWLQSSGFTAEDVDTFSKLLFHGGYRLRTRLPVPSDEAWRTLVTRWLSRLKLLIKAWEANAKNLDRSKMSRYRWTAHGLTLVYIASSNVNIVFAGDDRNFMKFTTEVDRNSKIYQVTIFYLNSSNVNSSQTLTFRSHREFTAFVNMLFTYSHATTSTLPYPGVEQRFSNSNKSKPQKSNAVTSLIEDERTQEKQRIESDRKKAFETNLKSAASSRKAKESADKDEDESEEKSPSSSATNSAQPTPRDEEESSEDGDGTSTSTTEKSDDDEADALQPDLAPSIVSPVSNLTQRVLRQRHRRQMTPIELSAVLDRVRAAIEERMLNLPLSPPPGQ